MIIATVNCLSEVIVVFLSKCMEYSTKSQEEEFKWRNMLFSYLFTNNFCILFTGIHQKVIPILNGKYTDFTQEWYTIIGY